MKPIKSTLSLSIWMLRLAFLFMIAVTFGEEVMAFEYRTREFYVALSYVILTLMIFMGGFTSKPTLTVVPALIICIISLYTITLQVMNGYNASLATMFMFFTLGLFFASKGTNK